jgi:hypothetical protein
MEEPASSKLSISNKTVLLGYNALQSVESQQTFRRNILALSSGSNYPSKILALKQSLIFLRNITSIFRVGLFCPEDGGETFIRNVC